VSGASIVDYQESPTDSYARLKIDDDGNTYRSLDTGSASWFQINNGTDWVRPTGSAPGLYEVRWTNATGTVTSSTVAEDTWHDLSTSDFIIYNSFTGPIGTKSTTFDIEIRLDGGSVLDSASYTITAETDDLSE
jgi:hypothetical protein